MLERALERLRKNFYQLYQPIRELRASPSPEDLLQEWRAAQKPSQEWRNARFYEQAIDVLSVAMALPRTRTKELVRQYIAESS